MASVRVAHIIVAQRGPKNPRTCSLVLDPILTTRKKRRTGLSKSGMNQDEEGMKKKTTYKVPPCFDSSYTVVLASCDGYPYALSSLLMQISWHFYSASKVSCEHHSTS